MSGDQGAIRISEAARQRREEALFEAFREALAVATSNPCVRTFRACVEAYDAYCAASIEGAEHGAA